MATKADRYPRVGSSAKRPRWVDHWKRQPTTSSGPRCHACGAPALFRVDIEVSWFRGDDIVTKACEQHRNDVHALLDGIERHHAAKEAKQ